MSGSHSGHEHRNHERRNQGPPNHGHRNHDISRHDRPGENHPALSGFLGNWQGTTRLAAGPWGPERTVNAEVTYRAVAGGFAVVQSYRHTEADGTHFEGHGVFTVDPDHQDVFWYYVDSKGPAPEGPSRCTWHGGILRVERRGGGGWTRHTLHVDGDVLTHVTELRVLTHGTEQRPDSKPGVHLAGPDSVPGAESDGTSGEYRPFMESRYRRSSTT